MRILKTVLIATIAMLTLNATVTRASALNEPQINDSEDLIYMNLEIPQLEFVRNIQLAQSAFDAPITIEIVGEEGFIIKIEIDGTSTSISSDGINARISSDGINAEISSDGINALRIGNAVNGLIHSDGINARIHDGGTGLIHSDGINARSVIVKQSGVTLFSETL